MESSPNIRAATPEDIPALARIHIAGWQGAYGGLVDQAYLDSLSVDERVEQWKEWMGTAETTTLIAEEAGQAVAFITHGRTKTPPPGESKIRPQYPAEIYALYIMPSHWRRGIGGKLLKSAAGAIKEQKLNGLCLWVLEGNARGKSFYEKMGGQRIGKKMIRIGPNELKEICYGWRTLTPLL